MSKISESLIWPLFFIIITLRVADISIANLDTPRNYLNEIIIFLLPAIAILNIHLVNLEFFKRIAIFFSLPITVLILSNEIRALSSLFILLLLLPLYNIFLEKINYNKFVILKITIFIVILYDLSQSQYFGLYSWGYYGRERLFLGIFHPKDQAYLIIYLYLLSTTIIKSNKFLIAILYFISLSAIYATDSRGALVGILIFGYLSFFGIRSLKYLFLIAICTLIYLYINFSLLELNSFSSNRIAIWINILNQNVDPSNSIDSSFLFFGYQNKYGLLLIMVWILYAFTIAYNFFQINIKYFILLITLGIFDLGLFSFSNLVAIHCWTKCIFNEKNK